MIKSILLSLIIISSVATAEETGSSKVQRVDFGETDINGKVRSPDGSYLVQKKGIDFVPMYKVKKKLNDGVKESLEYIH